MVNYLGRGNAAAPATEFFPLSGASASSPWVLITATTATGGGTVLHTADGFAQDVVFLTYSNVSAATLVAFTQLGSLATTGQQQNSLAAGGSAVAFNGNVTISKSGVLGAWTTATTGIYAFGYVARTYTATA